MMNNNFDIPKDQYVTFDAFSLKQHIKNRLNKDGTFTDQNYEGSNISTIIDIIAYTFNTLMFYLNKTSTESLFSDSQIYENMNRIVKLLDYKPVGFQTSTLSFQAVAAAQLSTGLYLIPRYSFMNVNGIYYSINEDVVVSKTLEGEIEDLTNFYQQKLLFQGRYFEYPLYTAQGVENEIVYVLIGQNVIIDHFNIDVYVKTSSGKWEKWERTNSLYLENSRAKKYEVRYNENKNYEIKFGDDINGYKLRENDQVAIYFLESAGVDGEVGVGAIRGKTLLKYSSSQFNGENGILQDVVFDYDNVIITSDDLNRIVFDNTENSTYFNEDESVNEIKQNAPGVFRSQYRVVTQSDYENYIRTNFSQIVHDVKTVNNWEYISEYLRYLYELGIKNPNMDSRVLYNQLYFGDACNFNNVYSFVVPRTIENNFEYFNFLTPSQKEFIQYNIKSQKTLTTELILMDPVYMAVGFLVPSNNLNFVVEDVFNSSLLIVKSDNSRRNDSSIALDVEKVFKEYFSKENIRLGQVIDINFLTKSILDINGVKTFYTVRNDEQQTRYEGLSLGVWNPIYLNDLSLATKNLFLPFFKIPYLYNFNGFSAFIKVQADQRIYESIEY
jgi:hypothetical protein